MISLSWNKIAVLTRRIVQATRRRAPLPDAIIAIGMGGVIPAVLIAEQLGVKTFGVIGVQSYRGRKRGALSITSLPTIRLKGKSVLLVDDIADSGTTLHAVSTLLQRKYRMRNLATATLVINREHCAHLPDFHAHEANEWVHFPWELATARAGSATSKATKQLHPRKRE